jgi:hypothetical protein
MNILLGLKLHSSIRLAGTPVRSRGGEKVVDMGGGGRVAGVEGGICRERSWVYSARGKFNSAMRQSYPFVEGAQHDWDGRGIIKS